MSGRTITEADLVGFANLTGDHHPQHVDASWAAGSRFGERVAHGMLVLSYAVGLVELDPDRIAALRRIESAVFKRPVRIGDTIRVEVALEREDDGRGLEAYEWRVVNQDGQLVVRAVVEAVVKAAADAGGARRADDPEPAADDPEPAADDLLTGQPVLL